MANKSEQWYTAVLWFSWSHDDSQSEIINTAKSGTEKRPPGQRCNLYQHWNWSPVLEHSSGLLHGIRPCQLHDILPYQLHGVRPCRLHDIRPCRLHDIHTMILLQESKLFMHRQMQQGSNNGWQQQIHIGTWHQHPCPLGTDTHGHVVPASQPFGD